MSSTSPVFILSGAMRKSTDAMASGLYTSFTIGTGQFCTKPGMVLLPEGLDFDGFNAEVKGSVEESTQFTLLTGAIRFPGFSTGVEFCHTIV